MTKKPHRPRTNPQHGDRLLRILQLNLETACDPDLRARLTAAIQDREAGSGSVIAGTTVNSEDSNPAVAGAVPDAGSLKTSSGPLPTPPHDKEMARRFLAGLDPNASRSTFQFFSDCGGRHAEIFHGTLGEVWPKVVALNAPHRASASRGDGGSG
jgi:hypothetical protein